MSSVLRLRYDAWDDFKRDLVPELFGRGSFVSGHFLFRGCGSATWGLQTSFDRLFAHLPPERRLAAWTRLVAEFRATCEEHGVQPSLLSDDRRLLAFGQHHGLPTRMLDWSLSPYVAAFFAFRQALPGGTGDGDVAVWVLDARSAAWSAELGVELVSPPAIDNVRLLNQAGRFTYARTHHVTLEQYVEQSGISGTPLMQVALPAREAARALPDLDAMGVSAVHLFPDMTGLAEAVNMRLQLETVRDVVSLP